MEEEAAKKILGWGVEKELPVKRRLELKTEFEKKAQAFLDKLAKETGNHEISSLDYGQLVNAAIRCFYPEMKARYYESQYFPLKKREAHSNAYPVLSSLSPKHLEELAELSALFFSFTRTRAEGYRLQSIEDFISWHTGFGLPGVVDALVARKLRKPPAKELEKPFNALVAGMGLLGVRMIDLWKNRKGLLHLVDTDPFVASVLKHYARINNAKKVVVHEKDVSDVKFEPNSLDYVKLDHCYKYMDEEKVKKFFDNIIPSLKDNGLVAVHELGGQIRPDFPEDLKKRGLKVNIERGKRGIKKVFAFKPPA